MYKVIKHFVDLQDNLYSYEVGDTFPHSGMNVSENRLAELAGKDNKQGEPLIQYVDDAPKKTTAKKTKKTAEK